MASSKKDGYIVLLAASVIVAYTREVITIVVIAGLTYIVYRMIQERKRHKDLKLVNEAWIGLRADHENMLAMQGDPAGVYGAYDAYTMPLTREMYDSIQTVPQVWPTEYIDYNDGLKDWK